MKAFQVQCFKNKEQYEKDNNFRLFIHSFNFDFMFLWLNATNEWNSPQAKYFSFHLAGSGWKLKNVNENEMPELIWIQNGEIQIPGVMSFDKPDYPTKSIMIFRKIIPDSILFDEQLNDKLIEITLNDIKVILDSMWNGYYVRYSGHKVENFFYHHYNDGLYSNNQYHYKVCYRSKTFEDYFGDGIGEFKIYIPENYKLYKTYYLLLYDAFLWEGETDGLRSIIWDFECMEDSVKN